MIHTRFLILYIFLLTFSCHCLSQKVVVTAFIENRKAKQNSDTIYYDFNKKLIWPDFMGKPDPESFAGAVTASGFAFDAEAKFEGKNIALTIGVYSFFTKHDSWKKPEINSAYHLLHEQHHFDITRIGAQILVQEMKKAPFTKDNYNALMNTIFTKVYDENVALQEQYDKETRNSIDFKKQLEWNNRIAAEIKKLQSNSEL